MSHVSDISGRRFGRLRVKGRAGSDKNGRALWLCVCDCDESVIYTGNQILKGAVVSCGCKKRDRLTEHGLFGHPLYKIWMGMKARCYQPHRKSYKHYGGRGIIVSDEWKYKPFDFIQWGIDHGWREGLELDRINNDGDYSPDNCRFVTRKEQARNRSTNKYVNFRGGKILQCDFIEKYSRVKKGTFFSRVRNGWSIEDAALTPVRSSPKQHNRAKGND